MRQPTAEIALELPEPGPQVLETLAERLAAVRVRALARPEPEHAYLVITPLGTAGRDGLERALRLLGVAILNRRAIRDWARTSSAIYIRHPSQLRRGALFEAAWRSLFPDNRAEAWAFDPRLHALVMQHKRCLRARLGELAVSFGPRAKDRGTLHALHVGDHQDIAKDARVIEAITCG
ncbi:MAG: hypothetical protein IRZ16_01865 [Myxococcaceae bacterium]|nr:hypothetical protein [Myxococcaceae bacterium]